MDDFITKEEAKELIANSHVCYQGEKIDKMHKIITGNGNPAEGMATQLILINERLEEIRKSRANVMPTVFNLIVSLGVLMGIYFGYKELAKVKEEQNLTNQILAPYAVKRGIIVDTIK